MNGNSEYFEKLINLSTEYLSEYLSDFYAILQNPTLRFQPLLKSKDYQSAIVIPSRPKEEGSESWLNPKLLSFAIISIFIGSTINALIPNRKLSPDIETTIVTVGAIWFFLGSITHLFCRLLKGKGTFVQTLSVSLQLFAVLHVVSSFAALIGGSILGDYQLILSKDAFSGLPAEVLVVHPEDMYFLVQFVLIAVYLPLAVKYIHGFGWLRQVIIGMLLAIIVVNLSPIFYHEMSILYDW